MRLLLAIALSIITTASAFVAPGAITQNPSQAPDQSVNDQRADSRIIAIPGKAAAEMRALFEQALAADRAADLADQFCQARQWEKEAKRNAWIAAQFKVARELSVPLDWTLDVASMTFRAPAPRVPTGSGPSDQQPSNHPPMAVK